MENATAAAADSCRRVRPCAGFAGWRMLGQMRVSAAPTHAQIVSARMCSANDAVCDSAAALNSAALIKVRCVRASEFVAHLFTDWGASDACRVHARPGQGARRARHRRHVQVDVQNTGAISADFTVTVGECSYPATEVPAQSLALRADEVRRIVFQISFADSRAEAEANCTTSLFSAADALLDIYVVSFSVNATTTDSIPISDGVRDSLGPGDNGSRSCVERCGSWLNVVCLYFKGCTKELTVVAVAIVTVPVLGAARASSFRLRCSHEPKRRASAALRDPGPQTSDLTPQSSAETSTLELALTVQDAARGTHSAPGTARACASAAARRAAGGAYQNRTQFMTGARTPRLQGAPTRAPPSRPPPLAELGMPRLLHAGLTTITRHATTTRVRR